MARQLTMEERHRLAQLHHRGFLQNQIAEALGRNPETISRELARNRVRGEDYDAWLACGGVPLTSFPANR